MGPPGQVTEPFTVVVGNGRCCPVVVTSNGSLVMVKGIGRIVADGLQQNVGAVRSTDGGRTWGQEIPITKDGNWFDSKADPMIVYTYPEVLLDRDTGIIWLLHNVAMRKGKMTEKDERGKDQWRERGGAIPHVDRGLVVAVGPTHKRPGVHPDFDQCYLALCGTGAVHLAGRCIRIECPGIVVIPRGTGHSMEVDAGETMQYVYVNHSGETQR